jgi:hypothetical protein
VRLEDGLVVFLAIATGGVLLAGLAQALEGRRRPPQSRLRPRPDARPGGAASLLPAPPTEVLPAAAPSGDEAPVSGEGARPDVAQRDPQDAGGSAPDAPVGSAHVLAAAVGTPPGTEEIPEALAGDRDAIGLRRGAAEAPVPSAIPAPTDLVGAGPAAADARAALISEVSALPAASVSTAGPETPARTVSAAAVAAPEVTADDQPIAAPAPTPPSAIPEDSTSSDRTIATPPTTRAATDRGLSTGTAAEPAPAASPATSSRAARVAVRFSPRIGGSATELTATASVASTPSSTGLPPDPAPGTAAVASARSSTDERADAPARPVSAAPSGVAAAEVARPRPSAKRARRPESRGAPEAGRSERRDLGWTRLSTEIDRLIARALDADGEVADGDASLSALSAAAEMLAAVPAEGSSPERRRDLAARLQSAYVELGNARRERGALEGALGPLSSAVELAAGDPERDREAREALARAVDALVDRLAGNARARIRADDLGGAMTTSRRLSQVVDDALARGLSPADLAGALARRQAVMLELAAGPPA